jgi:hypothetical protein
MEKYHEPFGAAESTQDLSHDEQPLAEEVMPCGDGMDANAEAESGPTTGDHADRSVTSDAILVSLHAEVNPTAPIQPVPVTEPTVITHDLSPQIHSIVETETTGTAVPAYEGHAVQPESAVVHVNVVAPISDLEVSTSLTLIDRGEAPTTYRSAVTTTRLL